MGRLAATAVALAVAAAVVVLLLPGAPQGGGGHVSLPLVRTARHPLQSRALFPSSARLAGYAARRQRAELGVFHAAAASAADADAQSYVSAMSGGREYALYAVPVSVGTPPVAHPLVVDTGSTLNVVVASSCGIQDQPSSSCATADGGYAFAASSSAALTECGTGPCASSGTSQMFGCVPGTKLGLPTDEQSWCVGGVSYGDGSGGVGPVVRDLVGFQGVLAQGWMHFLALVVELKGSQQLGSDLADGIAGFAYPALSGGVPTLVDSIVASNKVRDCFSMCLNDRGGRLVIGQEQSRLHTGSMTWVPITRKTYYVVTLSAIRVVGVPAAVPIGSDVKETIVDSGTTLTYVPATEHALLVSHLRSLCDGGSPRLLCGRYNLLDLRAGQLLFYDEAELDELPELEFRFGGGQTVRVGPRDYVHSLPSESSSWEFMGLLGVQTSAALIQGELILGQSFMRAFYTVFDRENARIGFAPANRPECGEAYSRGGGGGGGGGGPLGFAFWMVMGVVLFAVVAALAVFGWRRRARSRGYASVPEVAVLPLAAPPMAAQAVQDDAAVEMRHVEEGAAPPHALVGEEEEEVEVEEEAAHRPLAPVASSEA